MDVALYTIGFTLFMVVLLGFVFFGISASEKNAYARVRLEGQRYVAVIKELHPMRGDRGKVSLLLKLETPSGPVGKRLIVPLEGAVTWDFLMTARVTERPVSVHCLLSPIIEEAITQYGFVLGDAP
ncbi:hypothetical protein [Myxococcus landrumensis]|uniref:Uncharacterized protein n=1 Tax=Myxococcus landrumensis TaxID=2813577 RepID=A0ABX7NJ78_9BACT|nr:hypothetical protein [Myxococcus landrumus]QSQ17446.1 hypothetical protein JY572_15945 [Myxococcus landrumus]